MDPKSEELAWRLAETFGWDLPDQESGGLRQLAIDTLLLSVELRERADELDQLRERARRI